MFSPIVGIQIGPCLQETIGDHLIMARFILLRLAEKLALNISFDPAVTMGREVYTSSYPLNFSTSEMSEKGGIK